MTYLSTESESQPQPTLTPQEEARLERAEVAFTSAFNKNRGLLAGFAKCGTISDLHYVRDSFYLALSSSLCHMEYALIKIDLTANFEKFAALQQICTLHDTIDCARLSRSWILLKTCLFTKSAFVGTDLQAMWSTLEVGRMNWLKSVTPAHVIKITLKTYLLQTNAADSVGDVSDSMMVWIYAFAVNHVNTKEAALAWAGVVGMESVMEPLKGYNANLWDTRKEEWKVLEGKATEAAEAGGTTLKEAWEM